jgi:8-amino-7-oxononanoate synthase
LIISRRFFYFSRNLSVLKLPEDHLQKKLDERKATGIYRTLKPENSLVDFCSNDYLGFARSAELKKLIEDELNSLPNVLNGATGSRLLSGNLAYTEQIEQEIANYHLSAAGLIFDSGYDANLGLFSSIPQRGDTIITDELIHASIIDGSRLSFANKFTFKHNDLESLEDKLKQAKGKCYVAIESVYSMDGDTSPIKEILNITNKYGAYLIVDEAHAVGLYPKGLVAELGLHEQVFARLVTFGKALGCHGAIVLGSNLLRDYLINFSRSFIYTTAAPVHSIAAIKMAYIFLKQSYGQTEFLRNNIITFRNGVENNNRHFLIKSDSAIQCIVLGSNEKAKDTAQKLQNAGYDVRPILNPTVPVGTERIRICLHSFNTENELQGLINTINELISKE